MAVSTTSKEAIKTALATVIAYGLALQLNWDKPKWAALAVAMVSLATIGQSLNKAAMRMLGTLVGMAAALALIACCAQLRWLFMLLFGVWLGYCVYMMGGAKHPYTWQMSGLVATIICMEAGGAGLSSREVFNLAVLRGQETGLGVLVYCLIAVFLWPSGSGAQFNAAAAGLAGAQRRLAGACFKALEGAAQVGAVGAPQREESRLKARFDELLTAAETDDYAVAEQRSQWRHYQRLATQLGEALARLRAGSGDAPFLHLTRTLPALPAFAAELDARLAQAERLLENGTPARGATTIALVARPSAHSGLSHFHRAALAVTQSRLQDLDRLTRDILACLWSIKHHAASVLPLSVAPSPSTSTPIDPDRAVSVVRLLALVWLAFMALIYVDDLPGGNAVVTMSCALGLVLATNPQLPIRRLVAPVTLSVIVACGCYFLIMPRLSGFAGLASLIFAVTFAFCRLCAAPQHAMGRATGLAMFALITAIENRQSYSFSQAVNIAMAWPLVLLLAAVTAHIPVSPLPEKALLRLLRRYFCSCAYLTSHLPRGGRSPIRRWRRWQWAFHRHELATLPGKLRGWSAFVDPAALPGATPPALQAWVGSVQALSGCMGELLREYDKPQAALLLSALGADVNAWRIAVQRRFGELAECPAPPPRQVRDSLAAHTEHLEKHIEATLRQATVDQLSALERENFYCLLGACRAVSQALLDYAACAAAIDWARAREGRFA